MDDIATSRAPLIPRASNPVTWQSTVGGVAANAAFSARESASQSTRIGFCAAAGCDAVALQMEQILKEDGLEANLQRIAGRSTGRYTAVMDSSGELYIGLSDVDLAEQLDPEQVPLSESAEPCHALLMDANLSESCLVALTARARSERIRIAVMSVSPVKSRRLPCLSSWIDLLFVNRREAIAMIDPALPLDSSVAVLAEGLMKLGFVSFVLTDGSDPVLVQAGADRNYITVPPVQTTRSVNGAGDALAGASFAAWSAGLDVVRAVRDFGLVQSARVVSGDHLPRLLAD